MITRSLARLAPGTWLRAPRPTARLRLTLLYGTLFLVSGAVLLAVSYVLAEHATAITLPAPKAPSLSDLVRTPTVAPGLLSGARNHTVRLTPAQMAQQQAQVTHLHDVGMHRLLVGSGIALALMIVISLVLGWLVAGRVLRPVRRISAAARQISASNLHERLRLDGPDDEFRELAGTLDALLERLQAAFDSQRRFVANASHELRTPLTLDRALLERALRKAQPTQALWRFTCERLLSSSDHQARLIEALLTLATTEGGVDRQELVDLESLIRHTLASPELDAAGQPLTIHTDLTPTALTGDPRLLERLVRNLIENAIRHNIPNGWVKVSSRRHGARPVLAVTNTGPVVPPGDAERLLQPFQRAAADRTTHGNGHGLGLSIVHAIATAHHATLTLEPQPTGGLHIEVHFPPTTIEHHAPTRHNQAVTERRSATLMQS